MKPLQNPPAQIYAALPPARGEKYAAGAISLRNCGGGAFMVRR